MEFNSVLNGLLSVFLTHYCEGDKIEMRWAGHVARIGKRRGVHRDEVGNPEV
jgi:hypothetical protein